MCTDANSELKVTASKELQEEVKEELKDHSVPLKGIAHLIRAEPIDVCPTRND